ncbi:endopygalactorunase [Mucilaginibacter sp. PPCGB 2223]|uniref:endopygalactorunase n=1 Tax=Mucilaginibacter sp. PPCGB 2223 TaxID=1886027 RepID=UPI00082639BA|nr:endopygalactorunase [Mucilaginibacter sp. PPCGB 2223]OCX53160.1 endopygalactorunase [Mucilaginibacter sp. PPCGB 2223]
MKKVSGFILLLLTCTCVMAQRASTLKLGTQITYGKNATNIARITNDTIVVITGSTYRYTVDTPEDQGLVSTKTDVKQLPLQLASADGVAQKYTVTDKNGSIKTDGDLLDGDRLTVTTQDGSAARTYYIVIKPMALSGKLILSQSFFTVNTNHTLALYFTAGQRSPDAGVKIFLPDGINATMDNTTVNVIGRGDVKLSGLATQSIGRAGTKYSYHKVGDAEIKKLPNGGSMITFSHLDFRPANGADLKVVIHDVNLKKTGSYLFRAQYTTSAPEKLSSAGTGTETASLTVTQHVSDFERVANRPLQYKETPDLYTKATFKWGTGIQNVQILQSLDKGKTWSATQAYVDTKTSTATVSGLKPNQLYTFKLNVKSGSNKGFSNTALFYSGKMDVKAFGVNGNGTDDNTAGINQAIAYLNQIGGGTLLFSKGTYMVRTIHLMSNVYLYVEQDASINALKGGDAPETTWFSDRKYRSGLSPTDAGPYADPENYMTKQDVGHHYFNNAMFFGERLDNIKIIGNGTITGNANLVNGDGVMKNTPDNRCDKMFSLKLCTNIEIGGIYHKEDLWYDEAKNEPYYIGPKGAKIEDAEHMLKIDRTGHFALLATGTDNINVHDTYFSKEHQTNVRDVYDFMECNNVTVTNIFSRVSSDDVIKPGSDCSLGFTRPVKNYMVRNVIGDTNCNLVQIGSETADDIMQVYVDNIYILGANKAGFSISTNDGAHVKDVYLNSGRTGPIRYRSKMYRATAPFFISISNRGRIIGAEAGRYNFTEDGKKHDELLIKNVDIGQVENINLKGIDVYEVYGGSAYNGKKWKPYDGTQRKATAIVAGYKLPDAADVTGGLDFKLPNGKHTGYINNVTFNDVNILVKGGNAAADTLANPGELGVGQYNVADLKLEPSYGIWARHVKGLEITNSTFNYEKRDSRYPLFLDDVNGTKISGVKMVKPQDNNTLIGLKNASGLTIKNTLYYKDNWGNAPTTVPDVGK